MSKGINKSLINIINNIIIRLIIFYFGCEQNMIIFTDLSNYCYKFTIV